MQENENSHDLFRNPADGGHTMGRQGYGPYSRLRQRVDQLSRDHHLRMLNEHERQKIMLNEQVRQLRSEAERQQRVASEAHLKSLQTAKVPYTGVASSSSTQPASSVGNDSSSAVLPPQVKPATPAASVLSEARQLRIAYENYLKSLQTAKVPYSGGASSSSTQPASSVGNDSSSAVLPPQVKPATPAASVLSEARQMRIAYENYLKSLQTAKVPYSGGASSSSTQSASSVGNDSSSAVLPPQVEPATPAAKVPYSGGASSSSTQSASSVGNPPSAALPPPVKPVIPAAPVSGSATPSSSPAYEPEPAAPAVSSQQSVVSFAIPPPLEVAHPVIAIDKSHKDYAAAERLPLGLLTTRGSGKFIIRGCVRQVFRSGRYTILDLVQDGMEGVVKVPEVQYKSFFGKNIEGASQELLSKEVEMPVSVTRYVQSGGLKSVALPFGCRVDIYNLQETVVSNTDKIRTPKPVDVDIPMATLAQHQLKVKTPTFRAASASLQTTPQTSKGQAASRITKAPHTK